MKNHKKRRMKQKEGKKVEKEETKEGKKNERREIYKVGGREGKK